MGLPLQPPALDVAGAANLLGGRKELSRDRTISRANWGDMQLGPCANWVAAPPSAQVQSQGCRAAQGQQQWSGSAPPWPPSLTRKVGVTLLAGNFKPSLLLVYFELSDRKHSGVLVSTRAFSRTLQVAQNLGW